MVFKLANKDPNGNCTNGIDRIASLLTNAAGEAAKLNPWPHDVYMNVWVVNKLPDNVAGYALFPSSVEGLGGLHDGVIILHDYVGSIGTSNWSHSKALPHELGHTMGLEHTWGGTNSPEVACGDDGINDTPETRGFQSCPRDTNSAKICHPPGQNGPNDLGVVENYQNYMDYSYCSNMFTKGQREAMWNTLENGVAGRNNLWTDQNRAFTGIDYDPPIACTPKADFFSNSLMVCQGDAVRFRNASWRGATNYNWTFDAGTDPMTSDSANPQVIFNTPGWHTATLVVDNGSASDTLTRTEYIYVSKGFADYNNDYQESFEDSSLFANDWLVFNQSRNASHWQVNKNIGVLSHNSVYLNNFNNQAGDIDELVSPTLDLSQVSTGSFFLTFDYAVATTAASLSQVTDSLMLYYSTDCGKTFRRFDTIAGGKLITDGISWANFVPGSTWGHYAKALPAGAYNGNTRFKFQFKAGGNGNNVYIDNINISAFTGVDNIANGVSDFTVFPNPATSTVQMTYELAKESKVKIEIFDALGRSVQVLTDDKQSAGSHTLTVNENTVGQMSQGIYIVKLTADGISTSKRLAITK